MTIRFLVGIACLFAACIPPWTADNAGPRRGDGSAEDASVDARLLEEDASHHEAIDGPANDGASMDGAADDSAANEAPALDATHEVDAQGDVTLRDATGANAESDAEVPTGSDSAAAYDLSRCEPFAPLPDDAGFAQAADWSGHLPLPLPNPLQVEALGSNKLVVTWRSSALERSTFTPPADWTVPEPIEHSDETSLLLVDRKGNSALFGTRLVPRPLSLDTYLWARRGQGGAWGDEQIIAQLSGDSSTYMYPNNVHSRIVPVIDGETIAATWVSEDGKYSGPGVAIWFSSDTNPVVGQRRFREPGGRSAPHHLWLRPPMEAAIFWVEQEYYRLVALEYVGPPSPYQSFQLLIRPEKTGSICTEAPPQLEPLAFASDGLGNLLTVWPEEGRLLYSRYERPRGSLELPTAWTIPAAVASMDAVANMRLLGNPAGDAVLVWSTPSSSPDELDLWVSRYSAATQRWDYPLRLGSLQTVSLATVSLRMNPAGAALVVWGGTYASRYLPGQGWSAPNRIGPDSSSATGAALDDKGRAMVTWAGTYRFADVSAP